MVGDLMANTVPQVRVPTSVSALIILIWAAVRSIAPGLNDDWERPSKTLY
jgi:hypothetical protein